MKCIMCKNKNFFGPLFFVRDRFRRTNKEYPVFLCNLCKTLMISPFPEEKELLELYPEGYTFKVFNKDTKSWLSKIIKDMEYQFFYKMVYKRSYRVITKVLGRKQFSIFDIGCGNAHRLKVFKECGCEVYGNEISKEDVEYAKNFLGIEVFYGTLEQAVNSIDEKFDVVSLFSVLEHLINPEKEIELVQKILKPDGLLVIQVPVVNTIQYEFLGKNCFSIREMPRHLFIPSIIGLKIFMDRLGYKMVKYLPVSFVECSSLFSLGIFWKSNSCSVYQQNNLFSFLNRFLGWSLSIIPGTFAGIVETLRNSGIENIFLFKRKK